MTCVNGIYGWFIEKPILCTKILPTSLNIFLLVHLVGWFCHIHSEQEAEYKMNGHGDVGFRELDFYFWFRHQLWPRSLHLSLANYSEKVAFWMISSPGNLNNQVAWEGI